MTIDDVPWGLIKQRFHRLDSASTPALTLCNLAYRGWVWDAVAVEERMARDERPWFKKICRSCEQRAARLARIAAGTALFPPARPVDPEVAQDRIRRRRAQELEALDREAHRTQARVSARAASAGLPTLGRQS